jgi:hypothetical protein
MHDMTTRRTRHLPGLVLALLMLGGVASCARGDTVDAASNTPPEARHVDAMVGSSPPDTGARSHSVVAGLPAQDAAEVAHQELAYFRNNGSPATVRVGAVERASIATWLNARNGVAGANTAKVMWPDGKESGQLTVMVVRAAEGDLWAPRQRPGVKAEPLAGDRILVVYLENKPISRSSFTWSSDARAADWLATLTTVPTR